MRDKTSVVPLTNCRGILFKLVLYQITHGIAYQNDSKMGLETNVKVKQIKNMYYNIKYSLFSKRYNNISLMKSQTDILTQWTKQVKIITKFGPNNKQGKINKTV